MKKVNSSTALAVLLILALLLTACGGGGGATSVPTVGGIASTPAGVTVKATAAGTAAATPAALAPGGTAGPKTTTKPAATTGASGPSGASGAAGDLGYTKFAVESGASIVFSGWGDPSEQQVYRDSITRFNQFYPDIKVDYQPIPTDFQTKLKAAMAGGTAPDVFYVDDQLMTAFGPSGQIMALDDYMSQAGVKREDFIPQLLTIFTLNNKTYGLPKDWGTLGLVYLPEAFKAANIAEPTSSWTQDDVHKAAQAIAATGKYAGFCQAADWARFAPFVFSNGGDFTSSDFKTATVDTSQVKDQATFIYNMKQDGSLVTPSDLGASWCGEALGKKLVGMTYEGGWMVNFMKTTYADVTWKAVQLPKGPQKQADVIFTNAIGINAKTKYPKAAAAFVIFLTSRYNQAFITKTGFAYPTHPDQLNLIVDPNDKAISTGGTWKDSKVAYWGPNTGQIETSVTQALERIFANNQTVDQAFAQAQQEIQALLQGVLIISQ